MSCKLQRSMILTSLGSAGCHRGYLGGVGGVLQGSRADMSGFLARTAADLVAPASTKSSHSLDPAT